MKKIFIFLIQMLLSIHVVAQDVVVETNPRNPVVGEVFQILFKCQTTGSAEPDISFRAEGVSILAKQVQGLSTRTIYQNGKLSVSREILVSYDARADKKGLVHLRDVIVTVDGKTIKEPVVSVQVMDSPPEPRMVFLAADVPKKSLYVGEGITVRYYLYKKTSLQGFDIKKYPKLDGFMKRFLQEDEAAQRATVDGELFGRSTIYSARLYPTKPGQLIIDPMEISATYANDIFGNMGFGFGLGMRDMKTKLISSERVVIDVKPLPEIGKPVSFSGLVGKHEFDLKVTKNQLLVNEPLEMRLSISGNGNLENLESVELVRDERLEKFDSKSDLSLVDSMNAIKTFDYTYLAKKPGEIEERNIELSYFDPEQARYISETKQIPAIVIAGGELSKPPSESKYGQANETVSRKDGSQKSVGFLFNHKNLMSPRIMIILLSIVSLLVAFATRHRILQRLKSKEAPWLADLKRVESGQFGSVELLRLLSYSELSLPEEAKIYFKHLLSECDRAEFKDRGSQIENRKVERKMLRQLKRSLKDNV